jgi:hypothetical protein
MVNPPTGNDFISLPIYIMPPKKHIISIAGKELHIDGIKMTNNIGGVSAFKLGPDKVSGLTFDEQFWKQCFTGDSVKDGTSKSTQQGFLKEENGWTDDVMFSGDQIKKLSSQMVDRLYGVNMIFMAELLRFKGYKDSSNVPEELKTQFASAFPERFVYVNKDSGLDTDIILGVEKSKKCCNVATDIIDPHSSSVKDCVIRFPAINDSIVLDKSVFEYLQYPSETSLTSKTLAEKGKYESNFVVDGADLMTNEGFYFAGNKKKNAAMKEGGAKAIEAKAIEATESNPKQSESKQKQSDTKQSDKKREAMKLCVAKYSGDTLQSLLHRLFELNNQSDDCAYTISTCDSIVSLRSYALNGSFIEVYTEKENKDKKKVTKIYVWRQDLSSPQKLMEIFLKEKERIIVEYDTFIKIIRDIKDHYADGKNTANNIVIMGSGTTYRLSTGFYDDLIVDLSTIVGLLMRFGPNANPDANMLGQFIREIRTYKVNDFFKINGKGGKNYFMTMASKYTKGDLTQFPEAMWVLNKRPSETFFDCARTKYKDGGSNAKAMKGSPTKGEVMRGEPTKQSSVIHDSNYYIKTYFDFDYYKKNPCIFIEDNDDDNLISYDLHKEFTKDFAYVFNITSKEFLKKTNQEYDTVFVECFCDVINSFAILDIDPRKKHQGYYHPESIAKLCNHYYRYEDIRLEQEALVKAKEALALEKAKEVRAKEALALEKAKEVRAKEASALEKAKEASALEKAKEASALEKAKEVRAKEASALEKAKMAEQFRQLEESMPMEQYMPSKVDRKMAEQRRQLEETMQIEEVRRVRKPKTKHTSYKSRKPNASQIAELILKKNPDIISVYNSLSLEEKRAAFKSLGIGQIAIGRSKKSSTEKQILKELMRRERTGSFGGAKTRKIRK